jgi:hypothetical protein
MIGISSNQDNHSAAAWNPGGRKHEICCLPPGRIKKDRLKDNDGGRRSSYKEVVYGEE